MDPNIVPTPENPHGWLTAIILAFFAAIGGGGLTRIIDKWFGHKNRLQTRLEELETRLHEQMQKETESLRREISNLRTELDDWKRRYFELLEKKGELEVALKAAQRDLQDCNQESDGLRKQLEEGEAAGG